MVLLVSFLVTHHVLNAGLLITENSKHNFAISPICPIAYSLMSIGFGKDMNSKSGLIRKLVLLWKAEYKITLLNQGQRGRQRSSIHKQDFKQLGREAS